MPKLIPNNSFKALLAKDGLYAIDSAFDVHLSVFEGTLPTKEEILNCIDRRDSSGRPQYSQTFLDNVLALGNTELVQHRFSDFKQQEHIDHERVKMHFSRRSDLITPKAAGTAGWFLLSYVHDSNPYTAYSVYWSVAGTMGPIDSGADVELSNVALDTNQRFRFNNVTLNYGLIGVS